MKINYFSIAMDKRNVEGEIFQQISEISDLVEQERLCCVFLMHCFQNSQFRRPSCLHIKFKTWKSF